jgi:3',5'-cyclic AMP phosphodiesterase CpdA
MVEDRNTIKICHFSDLHLMPTQRIPFYKLLNKRALGYANLKFNRGHTHSIQSLRHLLNYVAKENVSYIVVTGDLTSLALNFEFETIDRLFTAAGLTPERTMVLPGNHDRYTVTADRWHAFEEGLARWLPASQSQTTKFPIFKSLGPVLLIGLDTAVWRNPVRAAGSIAPSQLKRLHHALAADNLNGRWPVIAMHHPPFHRGNKKLLHYRTGLSGFRRFLDAVTRPATVIHGHLHVASRKQVGEVDIIGVPSASNNTGIPTTQFAYYVYTFCSYGLLKIEVNRFWPQPGGHTRHERFELSKTD